MAFKVSSLAKSPGDNTYYDPGFRLVLETHLPMIRHPTVSPQRNISGDKIHQFEADFYGLLNDLGIPTEHHWIYMRANGMYSPAEFGTSVYNPYTPSIQFNMIMPNAEYLRQLLLLYRSTQQ